MSISYNSLTGLQGDPLQYISQIATTGKKELDSTSVTTRIIIIVVFVVVLVLYYFLFSSLGNKGAGDGGVGGIGSGAGASGSNNRLITIAIYTKSCIRVINASSIYSRASAVVLMTFYRLQLVPCFLLCRE